MEQEPKLSPLGELIQALDEAKIRFQVAEMTAAVLQGAPIVTFDTNLWMNLPTRQYIRVLNICQKLGATILTNNVVLLKDETRVDFIYEISGLRAFATEWKNAVLMEWAGRRVKVLPLTRVIRSKEAANRPKDQAQLPILRDLLASQEGEVGR